MRREVPKPLKDAREKRRAYVQAITRIGFPIQVAENHLTWIELCAKPPRLIVCGTIDKGRLWDYQIRALKNDFPNEEEFPWQCASTWTKEFPLTKTEFELVKGNIYIFHEDARID